MKRIILVEDNDDHALLIQRGVEDPHCSVVRFENGEEALRAFEKMGEASEQPDLVFLDLKLPGIDGFGVLERLRRMQLFTHTPVVILTTSKRSEEIQRAYQLRASGFVVKSEDFNELILKLKRVKDYWLNTVELPGKEK